jgi:hypothetical protein
VVFVSILAILFCYTAVLRVGYTTIKHRLFYDKRFNINLSISYDFFYILLFFYIGRKESDSITYEKSQVMATS